MDNNQQNNLSRQLLRQNVITIYAKQLWLLNIQIFRGKDFGNYACKARNSLGEAEARVQLHGRFQESTIYILDLEYY